jgi:predicted DNA-binding transcriptional regulator AlpA
LLPERRLKVKLIPPKALADLGIGFSHPYRLQLERQGRFPKRIRITEGGRTYGYDSAEVDEYLEWRAAARDEATA